MRTGFAMLVAVVLASCGEGAPPDHSYSCTATITCTAGSHQVSDSICASDETDARLKMKELHPTECAFKVDACDRTGNLCQ